MQITNHLVTIIEDEDVQLRIDEYTGRINLVEVQNISPISYRHLADVTSDIMKFARRKAKKINSLKK